MFELTSNGLVEIESPKMDRVAVVTRTGQLAYFNYPYGQQFPLQFVGSMLYVSRESHDGYWTTVKDKLPDSYQSHVTSLNDLILSIGYDAGAYKAHICTAVI